MRVKCELICSEPIGRFNVPNELGWLPGKRILLLRNSARIGWLEGEAEEGGVFAERTLFALAGERRMAELAGIECRAGLDHGGEDARRLVGLRRVGSGRVGEKTKTTRRVNCVPRYMGRIFRIAW